MYSTDRADALSYTLSCLRDMPLYDKCQRTLVVDGKVDVVPYDWQALQVPRLGGEFCWGRMWDAGVYSAKNNKIIYLDSDRLLPKGFLKSAADAIADDVFVFTSRHYMMLSEVSLKACKKMLAASKTDSVITDPDLFGKFRYEPRFEHVFHGPSKNVMSGSTGFTRKTYLGLGGVDQWYCGHGAFADTDFHMQATVGGCKFVDLAVPELHYLHEKRDDNQSLDEKTLRRLGLDNFIYYCHKWGLPMALSEALAVRCEILRPAQYVDKKVKKIKAGAK